MNDHRVRSVAAAVVALAVLSPLRGEAAEGARAVSSPFGGNGHNVSFDGRLMIVRQGPGWRAFVLRPERIGRDGRGFPDVSSAFSPGVLLQAPTNAENALAICEPNADDTPYRCNTAGDRAASGAFDCYDVWIVDSDAVTPGGNLLRRRRLFLQVRSPRTRDAEVARFEWRTGMQQLGATLMGIEPTVTRDGKLMVYQGDRDNDGDIDRLVYTYNESPCAQNGWSAPRNLGEMHGDSRLRGTYRLADSRLRSADGAFYGGEVRGAYPWLFQNGDAIVFTAANMPCRAPEDPPGCGPRRNALSVLGYPTNWGVGHIDGDVNPSTEDTVRLFFSSPGPRAFSTIPATTGIDVWPFFGSNTSNYTEISFDDGLDGRYAAVWHMNENVDVDGNLDRTRTPDTSGFFNTGRVLGGASFPAANNGAVGKAIELDGTSGRVEIPHAASLNPVNQLTVEMHLRPSSPVDCDAGNNYRYVFGKGGFDTGAYSLVLEDDMSLQARVRAGGESRSIHSVAPIPVGSFSHVAFTYDAASGELAFFVGGVETNRVMHPPATLDGSRDDVRVGNAYTAPACPPTGHGAFHGAVDEVKISNVVRYGDVIPPPPADAGVGGPDAGGGAATDGGPTAGRDGRVPPGVDGGPGPESDAGAASGGVSGGCAAGTRGPPGPWALVGLALVLFGARRRR